MRIRSLGRAGEIDVTVPDDLVIQVFGWRWPADSGEEPSKELFNVLETFRAPRPDTGIGVFRSREQIDPVGPVLGDWFVTIVDVNVNVMDWVPERYVDAYRYEPDPETATRLVLRHLRTMLDGKPGSRKHQRAHYGLGALLDATGGMHPRAGSG